MTSWRPSRPLKILVLGCKDYPAFATPWVHSGGMEVYVERLVRSLADRAEFTLWTAGGRSDDAATVEPLGALRGLRAQPVSLVARSWRKLRAGGARPDVVNAQTPLAALAARAGWRRFGIPYVVTVHAFGASIAHAGSRAAAFGYGRIERLVYRDAAAIVPTGVRLASDLVRRHPGAARRIRPVPPARSADPRPVDRAVARGRFGIPPDAPCLVFLGRIVAENAIFQLLESMISLRAVHPGCVLLVAGSGDQEDQLIARIEGRGLGKTVRFIGPVTGERKLELLSAADLLVRTSRHEVFPEAYLEALSVGTPVAATPAGDTSELATASGAVEILPFDDSVGQAAVIARLLEDPARLAAMRHAALTYSAKNRWDDRKELYWRILSEAASEARV